ncbi:MAG: MFS transporter [Bdellovibrionales bacterium RIFCSPHIGHO2_01_FULL_40_29]|nr:MAG: MFS transporter [Bdellovibrionales bacterium RIFCSPHIGHO2_01_FULL_40_29]OFZ32903.1 MAG: MFS transporter [Bdellovibrionales bacterium RIFCSPHIGHO2_02_FULL_40_15]
MFSTIKNSTVWRFTIILLLGFASGLPLALTGTAMQAWLTVDGIDIATIGFFSLVGLPYTFKFLWAPLMDRFEPPFLGRRRGWLVLSQLAIAGGLMLMSSMSPNQNTQTFALFAVLVAFLSASQDVVIDAYRTDILPSAERGMGSSLFVFGYRLAMIISGGIAFVWADPVNGNGWDWSRIYTIMAAIMVAAAVISVLFLPALAKTNIAPKTNAKNDLIGFFALVIAVAIGYQFTTRAATPLIEAGLGGFFPPLPDGATNPNLKKWVDMAALLAGVAFTVPLAWFASKKAKFETLNISLANYFSMKGAASFLALIILYKLGDSFAGSLLTPFLLKGVGFAQAEIGVVNKVIGLWLTIFGAIAGGALMMKIGLYRSLFLFGFLQLISNLGFWMVAILGKGAWGGFPLPAFDIVLVSLKEATNVDWLLLFAVGLENITGGMGTAAFVAFLMALCNQKFTATQYALLSAFSAVGRVWVGPLAGTLAASIGWPTFFIISTFMAIPGMYMLYRLRTVIIALETPSGTPLTDD